MKNLILTFLFIGTSNLAFAQFKLGVLGGLNISTVKLSLFNDIDSRYSDLYFIGIAPKFQLGKNLAVNSEVHYTAKGYQTNDFFGGALTKLKSDNIDWLPEIEFRLLNKVFFSGGAFWGRRLNNRMKIGNGAWQDNSSVGDPMWDYGLTGSAKVYFNDFFVQVRYKYGLANLGTLLIVDQNGNEVGLLGEYSRNIHLGVGYYF